MHIGLNCFGTSSEGHAVALERLLSTGPTLLGVCFGFLGGMGLLARIS
jgi:hypothetical protein